jgi:hypothetical protein
MSETLHLNLGGGEFEATPDNTTLFTFMGRTAIHGIEVDNQQYNHLFFHTGEEDDNVLIGTYMFRSDLNSETWDIIAQHMLANDYPLVLNRREVPVCDIEAYGRFLDQKAHQESESLGDFIPEGWE